MKARKGDTILVRANRVGLDPRVGTIVAVEGKEGAPPYRVRWRGDASDHLVYPGTDATIQSSST